MFRLLSSQHHNYLWEEKHLPPFDELILSWNAKRPLVGHFAITIRLFIKEWTPWLRYAVWGASDQYTFDESCSNCRSFQDTVEVLNGEQATGFTIRIEGASLKEFRSLYASLTLQHTLTHISLPDVQIDLKVPPLSQLALPHERCRSFCSPTSLAAVLQYHAQHASPLLVAEKVKDTSFDIYGNWIFNTAQAAHLLGEKWRCYVARLNDFGQIIEQLQKGFPVIASVKGTLPGAHLPYESGHLLVVKGYKENSVFCMDPAYPINAETLVQYPLSDF